MNVMQFGGEAPVQNINPHGFPILESFHVFEESQGSGSSLRSDIVYQAHLPHLYEVSEKELADSSSLWEYHKFRSRNIKPKRRVVKPRAEYIAKTSLGDCELSYLQLVHPLLDFCKDLITSVRSKKNLWKKELNKSIMTFIPQYIKTVLAFIRLINFSYTPPLFKGDALRQAQLAAFEELKAFIREVFLGEREENKSTTELHATNEGLDWSYEVEHFRNEFRPGAERSVNHRLASIWVMTELWMKNNLGPLYETFNKEDGFDKSTFKCIISDKACFASDPSISEALSAFKLNFLPFSTQTHLLKGIAIDNIKTRISEEETSGGWFYSVKTDFWQRVVIQSVILRYYLLQVTVTSYCCTLKVSRY
ncbi:hypothetical protein O181_020289 [Austropuccinia psidii MF-1]|uniref:Uncharacterized protein n=1 Tax=Austropuccinia psidii MF-1 TaxID=1389203 RepID=A0A9Q3CB06_9BASI|nr:hypothetical protein [Austropuccinia psidii MF-1]